VEFDVHTRPQVEFLHPVDHDRCTWLWMNSQIENHSWFKDCGVQLRSVPLEDRNQGVSRPLIYFGPNGERSIQYQSGWTASIPSARIQSTLKYLLESDQGRVEQIKKYYQADYDLIQSVKFYQN
jgi:hypothetical protein